MAPNIDNPEAFGERRAAHRLGVDRDLLEAEVVAIQEFVAALPDRDPRTAEEILGYDPFGLPR